MKKSKKFRLPRRVKKLMSPYIDIDGKKIFVGDVVKIDFTYDVGFEGHKVETIVNNYQTHVYKECGNYMIKLSDDFKDKNIFIKRIKVITFRSRNNSYRNSEYWKSFRLKEKISKALTSSVVRTKESFNKFEAFDQFIQESVKNGQSFEVKLNFNGHDLADWATGNY